MCSFFMAAAGRANGLSATCCFFAFVAEPPPSLLLRGGIPGPKPKDGHLARAPSKGVVWMQQYRHKGNLLRVKNFYGFCSKFSKTIEISKPFCAEGELPKTILCRGGTFQNHFVPRGNFQKPFCAEGELSWTFQNHFVPRGNFQKPFCAEGELPKTTLCRGGASQNHVVPRGNLTTRFCAQESSNLFTKPITKKLLFQEG